MVFFPTGPAYAVYQRKGKLHRLKKVVGKDKGRVEKLVALANFQVSVLLPSVLLPTIILLLPVHEATMADDEFMHTGPTRNSYLSHLL